MSTPTPLSDTNLCQVALIVRDIDKSAKAFAELLGVDVPPVSTTDGRDKTNATYRGKPTDARAKLAFFKLGPSVRLELIQPLGAPSTWGDFLEKKGEGVHHIAFHVQDTRKEAEALAAHGLELTQAGDFTGGRYAYLENDGKYGVALELLQTS